MLSVVLTRIRFRFLCHCFQDLFGNDFVKYKSIHQNQYDFLCSIYMRLMSVKLHGVSMWLLSRNTQGVLSNGCLSLSVSYVWNVPNLLLLSWKVLLHCKLQTEIEQFPDMRHTYTDFAIHQVVCDTVVHLCNAPQLSQWLLNKTPDFGFLLASWTSLPEVFRACWRHQCVAWSLP